MEAYQRRVIDEKAQLNAAMDRLAVFIRGELFHGLTDRNQELLKRQYDVMSEYSDILRKRIELF